MTPGLAGAVAVGLFAGATNFASSSGRFFWPITVTPAARKRPLLPVWSAWWCVSIRYFTGLPPLAWAIAAVRAS